MIVENFCLRCDYEWKLKGIGTHKKCPNCGYEYSVRIPIGKGKIDIFSNLKKACWKFNDEDSTINHSLFTLTEYSLKEIKFEIIFDDVIINQVKKLILKPDIITSIFKRTDNKYINHYQFHLNKNIKNYGNFFYLVPDNDKFYVIFEKQKYRAFLVKSLTIFE